MEVNSEFVSQPLPWRTKIALKLLSVFTDASRRSDGTVNRRFIDFFAQKRDASSVPFKGVSSQDIVVDNSRNLWFRVYVPESESVLPVVVFYHGGGFAFLSADTKVYDDVCRRFAKEIPAVIVSVDYRLSPEHRYPAQLEDGFDVLKFLDDEKNRSMLPKNLDLNRCFLAGDSAGANIAHHVSVQASSAQTTFETLKVIGLISIQPFFGGEERTEAELNMSQLVTFERTDWLWKAWLPEEELNKGGRDHPAINVSGPKAVDISGMDNFPATLVFVGGLDALQDWQRQYYHWLKSSGKNATLMEYPTMCHAFYVFPYLPESGHLLSQVAKFVSSTTPK